jgi:hypothetical protein
MSTLNVSNITDGTTTVGTSYVVNGSAKAWVNWNGTSTIAARDSFNLSSLTDNGTGDNTLNFTNAFSSVDFSGMGSCGISPTDLSNRFFVSVPASASSLRVGTPRASDSAKQDVPYDMAAAHGDLA